MQAQNVKATVANVISPVCNEEMHTELTISNFICITINTFEKNDL